MFKLSVVKKTPLFANSPHARSSTHMDSYDNNTEMSPTVAPCVNQMTSTTTQGC